MTREIKFRAKIVMDVEPLAMKKGHWVEGYYYEDLHQGEWCSWIKECDDIIHYKVDKNTLGQFTGMFDYSKKEIWEGDIVNVSCLNYTGLTVIKFIDGAFCMVGENWIESLNGFETDSLDIIGNIHDNPELMKGGAE